MRSIKMLLALFVVGLLICGSAAVAQVQPGKPLDTNMGTAGPTPFGPGEMYRPNDPTQKGWQNLDTK